MNGRGRADKLIVSGYSNFLFLNRNGLPKVAINYDTMFRELVKKYNKSHEEALPKVTTPHTLRHPYVKHKTKSFLRNFRFFQSQTMRPYRAFSYSSIILRSIAAILKFTSPLLTV